jgi:GntR family transcriptional repressor for pyruvate dehydrogenase complex
MQHATVLEPRRSLTETITSEITQWITSGRYRPGDHLPPEGELARVFNVSKPSVRESLKHLVAIGAVEIAHGKPPTVRAVNSVPLVNFFHLAVSSDETGLREAVELRRGLEIESALLATERATPEDIAELGRLVELLDQYKDDPEHWVPTHVAFHVALVRASHNRFYAFLQDALRDSLERTNRQILKVNPKRDPQLAFQRHLDLFEAIKSGKRANTRKAIESHFDAVDAVLKDPLANPLA